MEIDSMTQKWPCMLRLNSNKNTCRLDSLLLCIATIIKYINYRQVFIDALMAANSGDSIGAAAKIIEGHGISDSLTVSWFNNLANANHPTKEAIVSASVNMIISQMSLNSEKSMLF